MNTINNIWGTCEADAYSRDFEYLDYLMICNARNTNPVSEAAYRMFCYAFDQAAEDDQY
jgi:hypothetical protein